MGGKAPKPAARRIPLSGRQIALYVLFFVVPIILAALLHFALMEIPE